MGQRRSHGRRNADRRGHLRNTGGVGVGPVERTGELLEVERVATALLVEQGRSGGIDGPAEQLARFVGRQGAELEACQGARAVRSLERS